MKKIKTILIALIAVIAFNMQAFSQIALDGYIYPTEDIPENLHAETFQLSGVTGILDTVFIESLPVNGTLFLDNVFANGFYDDGEEVAIGQAISFDEFSFFFYQPYLNYNGLDSFDYSAVTDLAEYTTNIAPIDIEIMPVNDPPEAYSNTITIDMNTGYYFSVDDFPYYDADGDLLDDIEIIINNPYGMEFSLYGTAITSFQQISVADIPYIYYEPYLDEYWNNYAMISFSAIDPYGAASNEAIITIDVVPYGVVDAGPDQYLCENYATMQAVDPNPNSGYWTVIAGSGDFENISAHNSFVSNLAQGENQFIWTVDVGGEPVTDVVSIFNNSVDMYAGEDTTIYYTETPIPPTEIMLQASPPPAGGSAMWFCSDVNVTIANPYNNITTASNLQLGRTVFYWEYMGSCSDTDSIQVFVANSIHNAGSGQWSDANTWQPQTVPGMYDSVVVENGMVDIEGVNAEFDKLKIGTNGTITLKEDGELTPGLLYGHQIFIEGADGTPGTATLNIYGGGAIFVEQDIANPESQSGVVLGSSGVINIVDENLSGSSAYLYTPYLFVGTTNPALTNPNAQMFIGDGGHLEITNPLTSNKGNENGIVTVGSGGRIEIEQDIEKDAPAISVGSGGRIELQQDIEKNREGEAVIQVRGGRIELAQDIEKGNNGTVYVGSSGRIELMQDIEKNIVPSILTTPFLSIENGTVNVGVSPNKNTRGGEGIITSGAIELLQDIEKSRTNGLPNLLLGDMATVEFTENANNPNPAYFTVHSGASTTFIEGASMFSNAQTLPLLYAQAGSSVSDLTSTGLITGDVIIDVAFNANTEKLMASPTTTANSDAFANQIIKECHELDLSWTDLPANQELTVLKGYKAIFTETDTIQLTGEIVQGVQSMPLDNTLETDPSMRGWNFVGNSYMAAIDFEKITTADYDNTFYVYNPLKSNFEIYQQGGASLNGALQYAPAGQGFWVKSNLDATSPAFNLEPTNQVHDIPGLLKLEETRNVEEALILTVSNDTHSDQTMINLDDLATDGYDENLDVFKLMSFDEQVPQLFTVGQNGEKLAINSIDHLGGAEILEIPLNFISATEGEYTISVAQNGLGTTHATYFEIFDNIESTSTYILGVEETYTFYHNPSNAEERFTLRCGLWGEVEELSQTSDIYSYGKTLFVNHQSDSNAEVVIYNQLGAKVYSNTVSGKGTHRFETNLPQGAYIAKVTDANGTKSKVVVIF